MFSLIVYSNLNKKYHLAEANKSQKRGKCANYTI